MKKIFLLPVLVVLGCNSFVWSEHRINLSGQWKIQLPETSEEKTWDPKRSAATVTLPGSLTENNIGDDVSVDTKWTGSTQKSPWFTSERYEKYRQEGNVKIPFWLTPVKYYVGPALYRRNFAIPRSWQDKYITLTLERCHWETEVWVDGKSQGKRNSLSTPHEYQLGRLAPGDHTLTICVDNTVKIAVGVNAHSVSDHTQTNWNGIVGQIALEARPGVRIDDLQVFPDVKTKTAKVHITLDNPSKVRGPCTLKLKAQTLSSKTPHKGDPLQLALNLTGSRQTVEAVYPMGKECLLWNEFTPNVYTMKAEIAGKGFSDTVDTSFGMREIGTEGTQCTVNGQKIFLRGTLECCIFPVTGYPPTDTDHWLHIFKVCKAHGLNHMRFHSWCPSEAAFDAADRMGMFLHVECDAWAWVGSGKSIDQFIYDEGDRILKAYGSHPSFAFLAYGNEPHGPRHKQFLSKLVTYWKEKDGRRLYTSAAGWPLIKESDFHSTPNPRIQHWGAGLGSRINARPPETMSDYSDWVEGTDKPTISHEIGQWCVFPNLDEIRKYTGVTRAYNFEIFRDTLDENGMLDQAHDFLLASGKLQTICYKEDIESALRTGGFGGFQLLDLHDFPGQGTALVGVLDAFWDSKGYVTPNEFHNFCCETVPLARMEKRTWTTDETFTASVEVAHYGPAPLKNAVILWTVKTEKKSTVTRIIAAGEFKRDVISIGNTGTIGRIEAPLSRIKAATKLVLEISVKDTSYKNTWDVWVYPETVDAEVPASIHVTDYLTEAAVKQLKKGGKVLLLPPPIMVAGDDLGKVEIGFSSIFWNTAWTNRCPPHTLGILCDPDHPALKQFPTDYYSDWQWWELVSKSAAMIMTDLPDTLQPIVQVIDDWVTSRRLGLVFEAKVFSGKLLVCSIDLTGDLENRPAARQFRHSILSYMNSKEFAPRFALTPQQVQSLFVGEEKLKKLRTVVQADSVATQNYKALNIFDGNPATIWHTPWGDAETSYPHWIELTLPEPMLIKGIKLLPRQDKNPNGDVKEITVKVLEATWSDAATRVFLSSDDNWKTIRFDNTYTGNKIRIVCLKPHAEGSSWASIAEVELITDTQE